MSKSEKKSGFSIVKSAVGEYMKKNYPQLILVFVGLLISVAFAFVRTATSNTVSSFNIADYEVGQIADITIVANKSLPADYDNPVPVEKGEKITRKGFPITEESYSKLKKMAESPAYIDYRAFADSVIYLLLVCALVFLFNSHIYFNQKKPEFKELLTETIFYLAVYIITVFAFKSTKFSSPYTMCVIIPAPFFTFIVAILFGQLNALFFAFVISFGVLNACSFQLVPFLYVLATSLAAGRMVRKIERRTDMVFVSLLQALLNMVFMLIFKLVFNDGLSDSLVTVLGVAGNGFISGILCLGMLTPLELLLNTASPFRLLDLSDVNNPTLNKMLVTASGTYNHSLMVASLAEAACREIGANSLLARVGAYYHDIGKIDTPEFFVENQQTGENIHDKLNPSLSVSVIRSHVKRGAEKAKALHLPQAVIDIIREHHGNQVVAYFYNEAKEKDPNVNPEDYAYTGVPPTSRESAVVMLADTVEAACRSLKKPSVQALDKFIHQLIYGKIDHHQLDNCGLTFRDLDLIHDAFLQILTGHYHSRIEYPGQKEMLEGPQNESGAGAADATQNASEAKNVSGGAQIVSETKNVSGAAQIVSENKNTAGSQNTSESKKSDKAEKSAEKTEKKAKSKSKDKEKK